VLLAGVMGCADNPTGVSDTDSRQSAFTGMDVPTAMAPQQNAEDKPSPRLLALFSEFFPEGVKHKIPLNEIIHGGPLKDGIPALTNPRTIPANSADYLRDTDVVLGMTINGESRAYPLRIMNWHEIVNDTLGGRRILVTFCPLCGTGIAFDPVVDGEAIEFGVSGLLHNNDLLMYDRGTDAPSLWQQALGEAVVGPKTRTLLELLPITQTTWGEWKKTHPDTSALSAETGFDRNYNFNPYAGYDQDEGLLFPLFGEEDGRLSRKTKILGVRIGETSKAYVLKSLQKMEIVNDTLAGVPIVLIASPNSDSVRVYERKDRQFSGNHDRIMDIDLGDVWTISEEALANERTGESLERIPQAFVSFWFAWFSFYPDTLVFEGPANVKPDEALLTTWGELKQNPPTGP
jgi:hypothetical protein